MEILENGIYDGQECVAIIRNSYAASEIQALFDKAAAYDRIIAKVSQIMNERVRKVYSAVMWPILWLIVVIVIGALTLVMAVGGLVFRAIVSVLDALVSVLTCDVDYEKDCFQEDWSDVTHLWSRLTGGWRHLVELLFPRLRKARVRREQEECIKAL